MVWRTINVEMIIQRNYSSKLARSIKVARRIGNNWMTAIDNAGLRAGDAIKSTITGKQPVGPKFKFQPKTNAEINRATIAQEQAIKAAPAKAQAKAAEVMDTRVGEVVDKGIESTIRRPDVAVVATASQLTTPVGLAIGGPAGTALCMPGYSAAVPMVVNRPLMTKGVKNKLDKAATDYTKTGFSRKLRGAKGTVGDYIRTAQTMPIPVLTM